MNFCNASFAPLRLCVDKDLKMNLIRKLRLLAVLFGWIAATPLDRKQLGKP